MAYATVLWPMLLCSKTESIGVKIKAQEFYIEVLFEDGHSTVLFGHFTNKQIEPGIRCMNPLNAELNSICHLLALL